MTIPLSSIEALLLFVPFRIIFKLLSIVPSENLGSRNAPLIGILFKDFVTENIWSVYVIVQLNEDKTGESEVLY